MAFRRESVIKTAEKYVSKGKIEAAIKEYRKILQKAPNDISSLNRVGDLYARIQKIDDAVGLFEQIADRYTDDGFFPKAIAIYKKILKLDPRRLDAYQSLAELYQKQGLTNDARAQYQVLAAYYQKHSDLPKAIEVCLKMTQLEPENPSHHVKLADLYRETGKAAEALGAYSTIAGLMISHGHVGEAAQVYHRSLDLGASDLDFVRRAVTALKDAGDSTASMKLLMAAGEINPAAKGLAGQVGLGAKVAPPAVPPPVAEAQTPQPPGPAPPPQPARPRVVAPEPAPEFELDESFSEIESLPSTQVQPPTEAEMPLEAEAIDIGGGMGDDIPMEIDWSEMGELDDSPGELEVAAAPAELIHQPAPTEVAPPVEDASPAPRKTEDLLAEAEVFSKYGLAQKALDRFQEILDQDPDCLQAHSMRIGLMMQQDDRDAVLEAAESLREAAERTGESVDWEETRERLEEAGYLESAALPVEATAPPVEMPPMEVEAEELPVLTLEDEEELDLVIEPELDVEAPPAVEVVADSGFEMEAEEDAVFEVAAEPSPAETADAGGLELPELDLAPEVDVAEPPPIEELEVELPAPEPETAPPEEPRRRPKDVRAKRPKAASGIDAALAEITAQVLRPSRKSRPAKPKPPAPEAPAAPPPEPATPEVETPAPVEISPPAVEEAPAPVFAEAEVPTDSGSAEMSIADALDESGMDWLDEVASTEGETEVANEQLFDDEDDFFDLAAELQDELGSEDELAVIGEPQEQSLEEIVEGFKKGVSEALSEEDVDTHYNLGIAYREMGLTDEAIGEFQLAAKDPSYLVNCCAMLGVCFVEKGLPELAVKWYQRALEHPQLEEEEFLGLMYDLGAAQVSMGEHAAAHETFVEIYGVNSNYRDVSDRMQEAASAAGV